MVGFGSIVLNKTRKDIQMQKMTKEAILDLPLESFGIRLLSLWINRPEKWSARRLGSESEETKSKPKTVRELIRRYPYRFSSRHGSSYQTGLGSEPISELKKKLIELGLTPDDWPALVPNHKNLVDYLSMESIEALPLLEVFTLKNHHGSLYGLSRYLNCKEEEVRSITIRDFLKVNPYHLSDEVNGISGWIFSKTTSASSSSSIKNFEREDSQEKMGHSLCGIR